VDRSIVSTSHRNNAAAALGQGRFETDQAQLARELGVFLGQSLEQVRSLQQLWMSIADARLEDS